MTGSGLPWRALSWSAIVGLAATVAGYVGEGPRTAAGIALGAALGLFSLGSLAFAIPRLISPDAPGRRALLGPLLAVKLALIGGVLWFAMSSPSIRPIGVFVGAAIVPMVLVGLRLKCALYASGDSWKERFQSIRRWRRTVSEEDRKAA